MNPAYKRFIQGVGSNLLGPANTVLVQILGIPIFITYWGFELYGEWLLLLTVIHYLHMFYMGPLSVSGNTMTMHVGNDDRKSALREYHSALVASGIILAIGAIAIFTLDYSLGFGHWLNFSIFDSKQYQVILLLLLISNGTQQFQGIVNNLFRCESQYAKGTMVVSCITFLGHASVLSAVVFGGGPLVAAFMMVIVDVLGLALLFTLTHRAFRWVNYSGFFHSFRNVKNLVRPSASYIAYGLSNAIPLQISVTLVGMIMGPSAVAMYSTMRTLSRLVIIPTTLMTNSAWPEFSTALSRNQMDLTRQLFRRVIAVSFWVSVFFAGILLIIGKPFYLIWTKNEFHFEFAMFAVLLILAIISAVLSAAATLPISVNRHESMAIKFVLVAFISIAVGYGVLAEFGLFAFICLLSADAVIRTGIALKVVQKIIDDDPISIIKYAAFHSRSDIYGACKRLFARAWNRNPHSE